MKILYRQHNGFVLNVVQLPVFLVELASQCASPFDVHILPEVSAKFIIGFRGSWFNDHASDSCRIYGYSFNEDILEPFTKKIRRSERAVELETLLCQKRKKI